MAELLVNADRVVVVPGYGMAVAQAQHKVRELYDLLTKRGVEVRFAIHPVAGRMPGHMNVLLAESEIPYDALVEMDDINPDLAQTDVALVVGANDVVNPAARHDKNSPIFGMPIIDVDKAKSVIAIKRSMNPGFAGIDNELYYLDHTLMAFGDAKQVLSDVVKAVSGEGGRSLIIRGASPSDSPTGSLRTSAARQAHFAFAKLRRARRSATARRWRCRSFAAFVDSFESTAALPPAAPDVEPLAGRLERIALRECLPEAVRKHVAGNRVAVRQDKRRRARRNRPTHRPRSRARRSAPPPETAGRSSASP